MPQLTKDLMTKNPITVDETATLTSVAKAMAEADIGAVIVKGQDGKICGIVTDRDLAIRGMAAGLDPEQTAVGNICSQQLATLSPEDEVDNAIALMKKKAIRRIPITQNGEVLGILSLGDLAKDRDPRSALGGISAARANH